MATTITVVLTSGSSWARPVGITVLDTVEMLGSGGDGGTPTTAVGAGGGASGGYSKSANVAVSGATVPYVIGLHGTGTATTWNVTDVVANSGGNGGPTGAAGTNPIAGTGNVTALGGAVGGLGVNANFGGGGGAGSPGPSGVARAGGADASNNAGAGGGGSNGGASSVGNTGAGNTAGNGGDGTGGTGHGTDASPNATANSGAGAGGGHGGLGAATAGGIGAGSNVWTDNSGGPNNGLSFGPGGGGGGAGVGNAAGGGKNGGAAGGFGAGGGGATGTTGTKGVGGVGSDGIIVITYTLNDTITGSALGDDPSAGDLFEQDFDFQGLQAAPLEDGAVVTDDLVKLPVGFDVVFVEDVDEWTPDWAQAPPNQDDEYVRPSLVDVVDEDEPTTDGFTSSGVSFPDDETGETTGARSVNDLVDEDEPVTDGTFATPPDFEEEKTYPPSLEIWVDEDEPVTDGWLAFPVAFPDDETGETTGATSNNDLVDEDEPVTDVLAGGPLEETPTPDADILGFSNNDLVDEDEPVTDGWLYGPFELTIADENYPAPCLPDDVYYDEEPITYGFVTSSPDQNDQYVSNQYPPLVDEDEPLTDGTFSSPDEEDQSDTDIVGKSLVEPNPEDEPVTDGWFNSPPEDAPPPPAPDQTPPSGELDAGRGTGDPGFIGKTLRLPKVIDESKRLRRLMLKKRREQERRKRMLLALIHALGLLDD